MDITPSVLDGKQQIILANWPSYKTIICTYQNSKPVNIPSHPYVLLDRNILCNCDIEAEDNFLLESLAACGENNNQKLEMYFTLNLAFLDHLKELTETVIDTPIDRNWTHEKQPLLNHLNHLRSIQASYRYLKYLMITSNNIRNIVRNGIYTKRMKTQTQNLKPLFPVHSRYHKL